jgi:hypothetical protein
MLSLSLSGCGESARTLNVAKVERAIAGSILAQRHLHTAVHCPYNIPTKIGFAFTCTANLNVGTYPISVIETDGSGHVRYQNTAPLVTLDVASVEQAIRRSIYSQRHLGTTVTCPTEVIQKAGIVFTCTATTSGPAGGRRYPFAVTEVDGDGHVRYVGLR